MSDRIYYNSDTLAEAITELNRLSGALEEVMGDLGRVDTSDKWWSKINVSGERLSGSARSVLQGIRANTGKAEDDVDEIVSAVRKTQSLFDETEEGVIAAAAAVCPLANFEYESHGTGGGSIHGMGPTFTLQTMGPWYYAYLKDSATASASGSWLGHEFADGHPGVTAWIGKGSAAFENDFSYGEVNAYLGKVDANAKFDFSFFNGGESWADGGDGEGFAKGFNAEVSAGVSAQAAAVDGKIGFGDGMFGGEIAGEGSLGNAELSGGAKFSLGDEGVNAYVEGSAIVSAAEGEVSGTINFFGIEITGSASGYAGAAGVEGEAGIKDGSFVLKGGAAAGIGGSLGIEIGLSDEAQEAIGEVLDLFTFWD